MDNFSIAESLHRQRKEAEALRISEAHDKIVRSAEHSVVRSVSALKGDVKVVSSEAALTAGEGDTSTSLVFDGTVKVTALLGDKKFSYTVAVAKSALAPITAEEVETAVAAAEPAAVEEVVASPERETIQADLAQFSLLEDGSDYLEIHHTALDIGRPLSIISKDEYATIDKEALFRSALLDTVSHRLDGYCDVTFTGTFAEPQIKLANPEYRGWNIETDPNQLAMTKYKARHPEHKDVIEGNYPDGVRGLIDDHCEGRPPFERKPAAVEPEAPMQELPQHAAKMADTVKQSEEVAAFNTTADYERVSAKVANELFMSLRSMGYEGIKLSIADLSDLPNLQYTATLVDEVGEKVISISVPVAADLSYTLPKKAAIAPIVRQATDLRTKIAEQMESDMNVRISMINQNEQEGDLEVEAALKSEPSIEKTASDQGGTMYNDIDVMHLNKHLLGLPNETKVGTVVYADGYNWELVDKNKDYIGKEADGGSIWTFRKVNTDKKPDHHLPA